MGLPYLNPANFLDAYSPDNYSIGMSNANYFNSNINNQVLGLIGNGQPNEELKQAYQDGKAILKQGLPYGVTRSAQLIQNNTPGVDVYTGDEGRLQMAVAGVSPNAGGFHSRYNDPGPDEKMFVTGIADELDNLSSLQTLAHEMGHYTMGHSTRADTPNLLPDATPSYRMGHARATVGQAQKEMEAELVAVNVMNRLGYGYTPGVVQRSSNYIAGWQLREPEIELPSRVVVGADSAAKFLVPEPIRRFGPLSTRMANVVI